MKSTVVRRYRGVSVDEARMVQDASQPVTDLSNVCC